jgi:NAD(P)H-dependent FMN reductase
MKLLVFPGSRRADSLNRRLAQRAADAATRHGATVDFAELREFDVPLYDGDDETRAGVPAGAKALADRLSAADGFVIASPEYNFSVPGVLKNLVDWTSRLSPQPWRGKPGLLLSASPSLVGGNRGLWTLRVPLEVLGAHLHPDMFSLATAHESFAADGSLGDAALAKRLDGLVADFVTRVARTIG